MGKTNIELSNIDSRYTATAMENLSNTGFGGKTHFQLNLFDYMSNLHRFFFTWRHRINLPKGVTHPGALICTTSHQEKCSKNLLQNDKVFSKCSSPKTITTGKI